MVVMASGHPMYSSSSSVAGGQEQSIGRMSSVFSEEIKIRELAEQIRTRFAHAHQLKLTTQQQQQTTAATNMQVISFAI